jgi:putrescine aminotransferase
MVGEIRGAGLIGGIELVADKRTRRFFEKRGRVGAICRDHCFNNHLVMRGVRDTMVFAPPFIISEAELDMFVERAVRSIEQTYQSVKAEVTL